ncbi:hypothetical protein PO124_27060 [Bacillus licheniformis]|nr:hypothetical protein [Bacillus licheniformis]
MLGVELGIGRLFDEPTAAGLAKQLDQAQSARPALRKESAARRFRCPSHSGAYGFALFGRTEPDL